jgi:hypothetical protein
MTGTVDSLGRAWSHGALDRLLADPGVQHVVQAAKAVLYPAPGRFAQRSFEAWAKRKGRSKAGIALLFLLCLRSKQWDHLGGRP